MRITNTLTGEKEAFAPASLPVRMYVCGLTPKNEPHLGHARLFVASDVMRRYLEYRGYPVNYVQNFTDIDDRIIQAGLREGIPCGCPYKGPSSQKLAGSRPHPPGIG